jgi:hypothetical protein
MPRPDALALRLKALVVDADAFTEAAALRLRQEIKVSKGGKSDSMKG